MVYVTMNQGEKSECSEYEKREEIREDEKECSPELEVESVTCFVVCMMCMFAQLLRDLFKVPSTTRYTQQTDSPPSAQRCLSSRNTRQKALLNALCASNGPGINVQTGQD
jgi:hypothetical protein